MALFGNQPLHPPTFGKTFLNKTGIFWGASLSQRHGAASGAKIIPLYFFFVFLETF